MKIQSFWLPLVAVFFLPFSSFGQFSDDEASAQLLAVQCTVSSGFAGGDYVEYGKKLAKTLSLLSAAEQERVFGFMPRPGDAGFAASLGASADVSSTSFAGGASASTGGGISDTLASLGNMLIPDVDESPAVIAGVTVGGGTDSNGTTGSAGATVAAGGTTGSVDASVSAGGTGAGGTTGTETVATAPDDSSGTGEEATGSGSSASNPLLSLDLSADSDGIDLSATANLGSTSVGAGATVGSDNDADAWFDPLVGWLADEKDAEVLAGLAAGILGGLTDAGVISGTGVTVGANGEDIDLADASNQFMEQGGFSGSGGDTDDKNVTEEEGKSGSGIFSGFGSLFGGGDNDR
ncbi:MAG: hypothetical protein MI807_02995 [Verrucomicrobiales bacterium]|nr:hypothetical protein [Verrucomicrobiales bacterium]